MRAKKMIGNALITIGVIPLLVSCVTTSTVDETKVSYTKANIWYERPDRVLSTNYHMGQILPAGSEVEILSSGGRAVRFKDKKTGLTFTFTHVVKHSLISSEEFFERYFSETDISGDLDKFSEMEKKNIADGTVSVGMSKDAVFVAYGNPPSHKTPSLTNDQWTYWRHRFDTSVVDFKDGKVSSFSR